VRLLGFNGYAESGALSLGIVGQQAEGRLLVVWFTSRHPTEFGFYVLN